MALCDYRWPYSPVDPFELYALLASALGFEDFESWSEDKKVLAQSIVGVPFPDTEVGPARFRDAYLMKEVLRKYPGFDLGIDTRLAAKTSFLEDEAVNAESNRRLLRKPDQPAIGHIMQIARNEIARILGRFDEDAFWKGWRFGPHSTLSLPRHKAAVEYKITLEKPKITSRGYGLAKEALSREPFWAYERGAYRNLRWRTSSKGDTYAVKEIDLDESLTVCDYDRWTSVSKNALTDRGIGIPADMSVLLQLSAGRQIREKLFHEGINLSDQRINQRRALLGSLNGKLATVDVRGASQSIVCELVYQLIGSQPTQKLDWRWFKVLDALRAPLTLIDDEDVSFSEMHENHLFSAMGNGYTFELETLIFYALSRATCIFLGVDPDVTVYGDDIILPGKAVDLLRKVFAWCGFELNSTKSHWNEDGPLFRESCGMHYLDGVDVTPFYVDGPLDNPREIILLANNLLRWSCKKGYRDGRLAPVWDWVLSHLAPEYLTRGIPLGEANDGIILDWDEAVPSSFKLPSTLRGTKPTHCGWLAKTLDIGPRKQETEDYRRYLRWAYNASAHSGFRPPPTSDALGGKRFRTWGSWHVAISSAIKTAAEVSLSTGTKEDLHLGKRVVTSWPSLGPWVDEHCPSWYVAQPVGVRVAQLRDKRSLKCYPPGYTDEDIRKAKDARAKAKVAKRKALKANKLKRHRSGKSKLKA